MTLMNLPGAQQHLLGTTLAAVCSILVVFFYANLHPKDKLSVGLKCPGVEELKDGSGIQQFLGLLQSGMWLWGMSRWRGRGRRSLEFQSFHCWAQFRIACGSISPWFVW